MLQEKPKKSLEPELKPLLEGELQAARNAHTTYEEVEARLNHLLAEKGLLMGFHPDDVELCRDMTGVCVSIVHSDYLTCEDIFAA